jgi:TRAP-type C4-dicarboxylate transport system permease small subunit
MSDESDGTTRRGEQEQQEQDEASPIIVVAKRASRFSREFIVTVISVVTTAFGVVVALAWNTALSEALGRLSKGAEIVGLFIYAALITFMAVLAIIFLGRLATRMGAEPIQFALPPKKSEED